MEMQTAFNLAVGLVAAFGGWWMKSIYDAVRDLRQAETMMIDRVQRIELLVAGQYVPREEMRTQMDALFRKLDKIEAKIDRKADKEQ